LPLGEARGLPRAAYDDESVFEHERARWLRPAFHLVGREADWISPGTVRLETVLGQEIIVARAPDLRLRGFFNVCRHRGSALLDGHLTRAGTIDCPYHGQTYDLTGRARATPSSARDGQAPCLVPPGEGLRPVRVATWGGFVFASLTHDEHAPSLETTLSPIPSEVSTLGLRSLVRAHQSTWELAANWKLVVENFLESHHYPRVHPSLETLTPHARAETLSDAFPWNGGLTIIEPSAETVSLGGTRGGRAFLPGLAADERDRVRDYHVSPTLLISRQPDYLLTYRVEPLTVGRTKLTYDVLVHPANAGPHDDVSAFWDRTNAEDARAIERQQRGISSWGYEPGRLAPVEDGLLRFLREAAAFYRSR
jgi:Rieske 2Fe-2S family protein